MFVIWFLIPPRSVLRNYDICMTHYEFTNSEKKKKNSFSTKMISTGYIKTLIYKSIRPLSLLLEFLILILGKLWHHIFSIFKILSKINNRSIYAWLLIKSSNGCKSFIHIYDLIRDWSISANQHTRERAHTLTQYVYDQIYTWSSLQLFGNRIPILRTIPCNKLPEFIIFSRSPVSTWTRRSIITSRTPTGLIIHKCKR